MRASHQLSLRRLTFFVVLVCSAAIASGQEVKRRAPARFELLTNDSKPTEDAITSYRVQYVWEQGKVNVVLVNPADLPFKIELPRGYTLFNNLIYGIKTEAVFTGPTDITLHLPSAKTKETFSQLRVLYAEFNQANPDVPKWTDATLDQEMSVWRAKLLTESETKERLPNFDARTLHGFTEANPQLLIVAVRDPSKLRDKLTADLVLSGTGPAQVTEGRSVTYDIKVTNKGPDTATDINLFAAHSFEFVSATPTQGKCNLSGGHVYCSFPSLEKDQSINIKLIEHSEWDLQRVPPGYEKEIPVVPKRVEVGATEHDPATEDNSWELMTAVLTDPNKGPIIEVLSPAGSELFQGPRATVPIRLKATDPDGFVKKLEVFAEGKLIGEPAVQPDGQYELIYKDVSFGNHWVTIVATDNLGRWAKVETLPFFINGPTKVEITSPKAGSKLNKADGPFTVTIHASGTLKKVSLNGWGTEATPIGNDDYVVKVNNCVRNCWLQAIGTDEHGVESYSERVELTMIDPPKPLLRWFDGEHTQEFEPGKTFKVNQLILLAVTDGWSQVEVTKFEVLVNGVHLCTDDSPTLNYAEECRWTPAPGKYKLQVIATDIDGGVGKSEPIEVIIERP